MNVVMVARILPLALVGLVLGTGCALSGADANDVTAVENVESARSVTIQPSTDPAHQMLGRVAAVHDVPSDDPFAVRVYEAFGGDPAMNGDWLWMSVSAFPYDGAMFDLGLNIAHLESVESLGGGKYAIKGLQDTMNEDGDIVSGPFEATVEVVLDDAGKIEGVVVAESDGSRARIAPSTEADANFTALAFDVTTKSAGDVVASVYELAAGDPALNGDHLFLALNVHPWSAVYDLDLDVAALSSVSLTEKGGTYVLEIEGFRDEAPGESEPFVKTITFRLDDGAPGAIEMR